MTLDPVETGSIAKSYPDAKAHLASPSESDRFQASV